MAHAAGAGMKKPKAPRQCECDQCQLVKLKARVAELEAEVAWKPIAEAPKNGRGLIVAQAGTPWCGPAYWCDGRWSTGSHEEPLGFTPTHYRDLPKPPSSTP